MAQCGLTRAWPAREDDLHGEPAGALTLLQKSPWLLDKQPAVHATIPRDSTYAKRPLYSLLFTTTWSLVSPMRSSVASGGTGDSASHPGPMLT